MADKNMQTQNKTHKKEVSVNSGSQGKPSQDLGGVELMWNTKKVVLGLLKKTFPRTLKQVDELSFGDKKERSSNFLIEGDCLQVMASLHKYKGTVDLIYTDPPYNTGSKDFRYNDNWLKDPNDSDMGEVVKADDGSKHTKWLNFMTPRLYMMQSMLKPSGVIAISIDDRELFRLGMLMDSIFGEENRLGIINWQKTYAPKNDTGGKQGGLSSATEYVLIYARNKNQAKTGLLSRTEAMNARYATPDGDTDEWASSDPVANEFRRTGTYAIQSPFTGKLYYPREGHWANDVPEMKGWLEGWGTEYVKVDLGDGMAKALVIKDCKFSKGEATEGQKVLEKAKENALAVMKRGQWPKLIFTDGGMGGPRLKRYLKDVKSGKLPMTFWMEEDYTEPLVLGSQSWKHAESGHNDAAKKLLAQIVGDDHDFETPKPLLLLEKIIQLWCPPEGLVLDPFAGSGTTAHAALSLNKKTKTNRKFILIEAGNPKEKDYFSRDLTAERIKRVISGKWANPQKWTVPLGNGFTYLRANGKVDRNAILGMERAELIDLIFHADWDRNKKSISWLEKVPPKDYKYLIAKNKKNQAVCLIWNGKNKEATVNSEVYAQALKEVQDAGLELPLRIYGKRCTYEIDDMVFLQIPDELLNELGLEDSTEE